MGKKEIIGKECRFAKHIRVRQDKGPDVHLIKEIVHYSDGTREPNLKIVKNFKRPFFVTKKQYRNHKHKKDFEELSRVDRYECTERDLHAQLSKALDVYGHVMTSELFESPYVYGADVPSTSFIKRAYAKKWSNLNTPWSVAMLDIETDVVHNTNDVILLSIVRSGELVCFVDKTWIETSEKNFIEQVRSAIDENLREYIDEHNIKIKLTICSSPLTVIQEAFKKLHQWKPDIVAIWNINYDIPKIIETIEKYNGNPYEIFSDPSVPRHLRRFHYKEGKKIKITSSGKAKPLKPAERWHVLTTSASFEVMDAMCVYKRLRQASQDLPSYSLDFILNKELGERKLKFDKTNHLSGLEWHIEMQKNYKAEYTVYNMFDVIGMLLLEKKTLDLSVSMPSLADTAPLNKFDSTTRIVCTALFWFALEEKKLVLASKGFIDDDRRYIFDKDKENPLLAKLRLEEGLDENEEDEEEMDTLGLKGWIVTLPSYMTVKGLKMLEDLPDLRTNIRLFVSDQDAESAYPSAIEISKVSKVNTLKEVCDIEGVEDTVFRFQNLNFICGPVNHAEYAQKMLDMPTLSELMDLID